MSPSDSRRDEVLELADSFVLDASVVEERGSFFVFRLESPPGLDFFSRVRVSNLSVVRLWYDKPSEEYVCRVVFCNDS